MKRTKRYGGFLIGDRVKHKKFGKGVVEGYFNGCIFVWFDKFVMNGDYFGSSIAPNQLINLTRIEEEKVGRFLNKAINEGVFEIPLTEEDAKDIIAKKQQEYVKHFARKHFGDPLPSPYTRDVYTTTKDYD